MQDKSKKISERAYNKFMQRGGEHGHDVEDWIEAEKEVLDSLRKSSVPKSTTKSTKTVKKSSRK
jgi:hypothetical protein